MPSASYDAIVVGGGPGGAATADVFLHLSNAVATRAERPWEEDLRGYDAIQLASALLWKEGSSEDVTFATDKHALTLFPEDLPGVLRIWRQT